jgi:hypothetical protein
VNYRILADYRELLIAASVELSGKTATLYNDIYAVMDAKGLYQNNFSSNKSFQTINPL